MNLLHCQAASHKNMFLGFGPYWIKFPSYHFVLESLGVLDRGNQPVSPGLRRQPVQNWRPCPVRTVTAASQSFNLFSWHLTIKNQWKKLSILTKAQSTFESVLFDGVQGSWCLALHSWTCPWSQIRNFCFPKANRQKIELCSGQTCRNSRWLGRGGWMTWCFKGLTALYSTIYKF